METLILKVHIIDISFEYMNITSVKDILKNTMNHNAKLNSFDLRIYIGFGEQPSEDYFEDGGVFKYETMLEHHFVDNEHSVVDRACIEWAVVDRHATGLIDID